jgi:hypothetical protein
MNRFSVRMVLFVLALSAVHMAAMQPLAHSNVDRQAQTAASQRSPTPAHGLYGSLHIAAH